MKFPGTFIIFLALVACVGVDELDDPADPSILTDVTSVSLMIGDSKQVSASYWYNMWVERPEVVLTWTSQNDLIASVTQQGLIEGHSKGQTRILVFNPGVDTAWIDVTVIASALEVSKVVISAPKTSFMIGETIQLSSQAYDINDNELAGETQVWSSSDTTIVKIDSTGLATAIGDGAAFITSTIDEVNSAPFKLIVGEQAKTGTFQGSGSYNTSGTATLLVNESGDLILELGADFKTSFALGTYAYLANSTTGTVVRAQGLEISEIKSDGAQTFNVSNIDNNVSLEDYQYVIMLCRPASVTFGYAELK